MIRLDNIVIFTWFSIRLDYFATNIIPVLLIMMNILIVAIYDTKGQVVANSNLYTPTAGDRAGLNLTCVDANSFNPKDADTFSSQTVVPKSIQDMSFS